jgi:hypothetical protein
VGEVLHVTGRIESPPAALFSFIHFVRLERGRVVLEALQGGRGGEEEEEASPPPPLLARLVVVGACAETGHPRREEEGSSSSPPRGGGGGGGGWRCWENPEAQQRGCDSDVRCRGRYQPDRRRRGRSGGLGGQHLGFVFFFFFFFACVEEGRRRHRRRRRERPLLLVVVVVVTGSRSRHLRPASPVGGEVGYRPLPSDALAGRARDGHGGPAAAVLLVFFLPSVVHAVQVDDRGQVLAMERALDPEQFALHGGVCYTYFDFDVDTGPFKRERERSVSVMLLLA